MVASFPGGADWQVVRPDGVLAIEAKYTLEASDGALIMVTNRGMRHGPPEVIEKLTRGEAVDPAHYYFRTVRRVRSAAREQARLAESCAVSRRRGTREPGAAIIRFHELL